MGVLSGQALQGLLSPHGQIQNLPGNGAWHFFRLQQGCECAPLIKLKEETDITCILPMCVLKLNSYAQF